MTDNDTLAQALAAAFLEVLNAHTAPADEQPTVPTDEAAGAGAPTGDETVGDAPADHAGSDEDGVPTEGDADTATAPAGVDPRYAALLTHYLPDGVDVAREIAHVVAMPDGSYEYRAAAQAAPPVQGRRVGSGGNIVADETDDPGAGDPNYIRLHQVS